MASPAVQQLPLANDLPETMSEKTMPIESTPVVEPTAPAPAPPPQAEPTAEPVSESAPPAPPAPEPVPKDDAPQTPLKDAPEAAIPAETPAEPVAAPAEAASETAPPPPIEKEPPTKPLPDLPPPTTAAPSAPTPTRTYKIAEDEPSSTKSVPYAHPDASAVTPTPVELTPEQSTKYDDLLSLCKAITDVPVAKSSSAERKPLTDSERMYMTKECLLRYLRATKWNVSDARKRIEATITWRREYGVEAHTAEHIEPENETGKQVVFGFDKEARPCLYLNPARQNTPRSERQIQHLVWMMERVLELAPPGSETLALLIDFKAATSGQNASVGQGKQVMDILQNHYPERLGRALVVNIPWWANLFLKAIWPFIDPVTRPKLKFNDDMSLHVPKSHLLKEFKGDVDFTYDHPAYWPNFVDLCAERRRRYEERWRANGGQIGESEFYLKGGEKSKPLPTAGDVEKVAEGVQNVTV
ncbi:Patellin-3 [Orbilia brochopaga]|nr:Patellin-3 [Drechslerella brochopaga]